MQLLGNLHPAEFLEQYWQKKPLLIKQALPDYTSPISPEELAGLACEQGIESRLIEEHGKNNTWQVRYGPFKETDFTSLPNSHWSLLVQAVDHHIPELSQLLEQFSFIPNWRIDDLMISYAPAHGSVGPHLDNYDVFLLQVEGRRHWHINENDYTEDDYIDDLDLKILKSFESQEDWVLEPGDMLYLPPGIAHHGIALDRCLTYSIGFRAPSQKELLSAYTVNFNNAEKDIFYTDTELTLQDHSGEILPKNIQSLRKMLLDTLSDEAGFASWFGSFITDNIKLYENDQEILSKTEFQLKIKQTEVINRYGNIRMAYIQNDNGIKFFYAGNEINLANEQLGFVQYLSGKHRMSYTEMIKTSDEQTVLNLLYQLYSEDCFYFDE